MPPLAAGLGAAGCVDVVVGVGLVGASDLLGLFSRGSRDLAFCISVDDGGEIL